MVFCSVSGVSNTVSQQAKTGFPTIRLHCKARNCNLTRPRCRGQVCIFHMVFSIQKETQVPKQNEPTRSPCIYIYIYIHIYVCLYVYTNDIPRMESLGNSLTFSPTEFLPENHWTRAWATIPSSRCVQYDWLGGTTPGRFRCVT